MKKFILVSLILNSIMNFCPGEGPVDRSSESEQNVRKQVPKEEQKGWRDRFWDLFRGKKNKEEEKPAIKGSENSDSDWIQASDTFDENHEQPQIIHQPNEKNDEQTNFVQEQQQAREERDLDQILKDPSAIANLSDEQISKLNFADVSPELFANLSLKSFEALLNKPELLEKLTKPIHDKPELLEKLRKQIQAIPLELFVNLSPEAIKALLNSPFDILEALTEEQVQAINQESLSEALRKRLSKPLHRAFVIKLSSEQIKKIFDDHTKWNVKNLFTFFRSNFTQGALEHMQPIYDKMKTSYTGSFWYQVRSVLEALTAPTHNL